ncbi:cupin domain-containing protein [Pseudomonas nicosulfuronedens]|uniref:Cupin domain-containing protein n=1 Tax=Pseudomonas nicosulfuronedens TaxID=2571105 RepID=A0A5R9R6T7_9PSED|nr:cupin domain-containing protein [Pseudomonas nicosulfuronedens]MDH1009806.1 cupin domain-containing protein [Pseudomonas nicosulfuronedens]MDH1978782.1 cupin domain-containing protein [Pseudomonas nicosulfuronedens]MDH2027634.1 cupin domain-containing protein [Pseudomonas nicosulfuronedens]TLX78544.1 cupin domain-containing protein [Pseudomonas nicosulfuronedens]
MHPRARYLIDTLQLSPHPEGGFYRRVFESGLLGADGRPQSSAILFLLPAGTVSRWHRVDADELWHFHEGSPLELLIAEQPDADVRRETLGPVGDDSLPQRAVPAHAWQAARCLGDYVLVGCTVSPAFEFAGFRLLSDDVQAQREWPKLVGEFVALI